MKIARLDAALVQKIAAGEVVERPASAVKELLENALDAKSESIAADLEAGGTRAIGVRDDGEGMDETDLLACTERHATSKLRFEEDLDRIATLGFRGEALASIAAVARVRIASCPRGETEAREVRVEAGAVSGPFPAAHAPGTTVEVRDLFFNIPARARFLGSPRTEFLQVSRVVHRIALAVPGVGLTLRHDGRAVMDAPAASTLLDRIAQVYGTEVARGCIPIDETAGSLRISGFISRPDLRRGNRRDQLFCVNGRPVSDRALSYVLAEAYRGVVRPGSYPIAVVRIELPLDEVDVNVHPRKEEVRFARPREVQDALARALAHALRSRFVVPTLGVREPSPETPSAPRTMRREEPGLRPAATLPFDLRRETEAVRATREEMEVRGRGERRAIGQLLDTYLLVQGSDGLEIIDQHIAHERILYERLRAELVAGGIARQEFLLPVRVEVPFEASALLSSAQTDLAQAGLTLEDFGGGTLLLREYPALLAESQAKVGFQRAIDEIVDVLGEGGSARESLFDRVLSSLACAASVKAGDRLPLVEQQGLVDRLFTLENPYSCPHGRPIVVALSKDDLERRFRRA